jgi:hypothetical protein
MYSYVLIAFFFLHLALCFLPFSRHAFSFSAFILSSFFVAFAVGVAWGFWSALSFALFLSLTVPLLLYEIDL